MLVSGMAATVRRCESLREIIKKFDKATSDVSLGVVVPQTVPEDPGPVTEDNWQQRCLYDMELDRERNHEQDKPVSQDPEPKSASQSIQFSFRATFQCMKSST